MASQPMVIDLDDDEIEEVCVSSRGKAWEFEVPTLKDKVGTCLLAPTSHPLSPKP